MSTIYHPNMDIKSKFERRGAKLMGKRPVTMKLDRPIISFSFDDCPRSALENAAPLLEDNGWQGTFYMAMGLCDSTNHLGQHMSAQDVQAAHKSGHEIADHTFSHIDGQQTALKEFKADIDKNQAAITALGIPPSRNFAYPYGCVSPKLKKHMARKFDLIRGVHDPDTSETNTELDTALLPSMRMYNGNAVNDIIQTIGRLKHDPQWLTLFTHDVRETPSDFGCRPDDIKRIIYAIKESGARVMTMIDALDYLQAEPDNA